MISRRAFEPPDVVDPRTAEMPNRASARLMNSPSWCMLIIGQIRSPICAYIINNSRYALNERYQNSSPEKKIIISCEKITEEGEDKVRTVIRDLGTGIPQGILNKLFEPFFTSKPKGQGTGLGMSISFGIIQNHGGTLSIDSILNKYTDVVFEIPASGSGSATDA